MMEAGWMARWQRSAQWETPRWGAAPRPVAAASGGPARLDPVLAALYDEAMARFDAFCFWYARPARSRAGMREVAKRLEAYGSPEALRIAEAVRAALDEG
jgi:hypothetical protein